MLPAKVGMDIILKVCGVLACRCLLRRLALHRGRGGSWAEISGNCVQPKLGTRRVVVVTGAGPVLAVVLLALQLGRTAAAVVFLTLQLGRASAVVLLALQPGILLGRGGGPMVKWAP